MENSMKKLRLEDIKVESFVTAFTAIDEDTVRAGGTCDGSCAGDNGCSYGPPSPSYQDRCTTCCPVFQ